MLELFVLIMLFDATVSHLWLKFPERNPLCWTIKDCVWIFSLSSVLMCTDASLKQGHTCIHSSQLWRALCPLVFLRGVVKTQQFVCVCLSKWGLWHLPEPVERQHLSPTAHLRDVSCVAVTSWSLESSPQFTGLVAAPQFLSSQVAWRWDV